MTERQGDPDRAFKEIVYNEGPPEWLATIAEVTNLRTWLQTIMPPEADAVQVDEEVQILAQARQLHLLNRIETHLAYIGDYLMAIYMHVVPDDEGEDE